MAIENAEKAIKAAYAYLMRALFASNVHMDRVSNFRVEEAEINDIGNYRITLSYDVVGEFAFDRQRELKDFEVDKENNVLSMKIHPKG